MPFVYLTGIGGKDNCALHLQATEPTSAVVLPSRSDHRSFSQCGVAINKFLPQRCSVSLLHTFEYMSFVSCVKFSSDGNYIAAGSRQRIELLDPLMGKKNFILDESQTRGRVCNDIVFSEGWALVMVCFDMRIVEIWRVERWVLIKTFVISLMDDITNDVAFSSHGNFLVVAYNNDII